MESENILDIHNRNGKLQYELSYPGGFHTGGEIINPSTNETLENLSILTIKSEGEYPISSKISNKKLVEFRNQIKTKYPNITTINIEYN